jgi:hypothetical protein
MPTSTQQHILNRIQARESFLLANDGQYLGKLSLNRFDPESIFNQFGYYGNPYSFTSIFNQFANYGSPYSSLSPYNQFTHTPPKIYLRGRQVGLLTKNRFLGFNNVDPDQLLDWMKTKGLSY